MRYSRATLRASEVEGTKRGMAIGEERASAPFRLDPGVADVPVPALRALLEDRIAHVIAVTGQVELQAVEVAAQRVAALQRLRASENRRQDQLLARRRPTALELIAVHSEYLALSTDLARLDEKSEGLAERLRMLEEDLTAATRLVTELTAVSDAIVDPVAARETLAVRALFELVRRDHAATAEQLLGGPGERLSDASLHADMVERCLRSGDEIGAVNEAGLSRDSVLRAMSELHGLALHLHPLARGERLLDALRDLVIHSSTLCPTTLDVVGDDADLGFDVSLSLFRIAQEAVSNAHRHAEPRTIEVVVSITAAKVFLVVRDDGVGFDVVGTEGLLGRSECLGLVAMRGRAEGHNGGVEIRSLIGGGTEVRAVLTR